MPLLCLVSHAWQYVLDHSGKCEYSGMFHSRVMLRYALLLLLLSFTACQSPQQRLDTLAQQSRLERHVLQSAQGYKHLIYSSHLQSKPGHLHIYLESDGSPWIRPNIVSMDPTPRNPLALRLMLQDTSPSVYLGRPCYHGFQNQNICSPLLWTHARYSDTVVTSMADIVDQLRQRYRFERVEFIGYSGGGVLAMLLAEQVPQTDRVVTIAANLDIDAWTEYHHYTPLGLSINPAKHLKNTMHITQYHLYGLKDETVPAFIPQRMQSSIQSKQVNFIAFKDYDHRCCWLNVWPSLLQQFGLNE